MQIYKIEKGVPLSKPVSGKADGKPSRAALTMQAMVKGDSFQVKDALEGVRAEKVVRDRNRRERMSGGGRKYVARRIGNGYRVWRVK